jgi:hypothetical protein
MRSALLALFVMSLMSSCKDHLSGDGVGDVTVRFKLMYGDKPLEMFKNYTYPGTNDSIFFNRMSLFVSNLGLTSPEHNHVLEPLNYYNLTAAHTGAAKANEGFKVDFKNVNEGKYERLVFDIGVPDNLNSKKPAQQDPSSVLSLPAEHWPAWESYIFVRPEGKIALTPNTKPDESFALHLGTKNAYRSFSLPRSIEVKAGVNTLLDIEIDMAKFFVSSAAYDIKSTPQIHSPAQAPLVVVLANNLANAVK